MKKPKDAKAEVTAIISILSKNLREEKRFESSEICYSVHLSFVGATILPPYLPAIEQKARKKTRVSILENLDKLREFYKNCFSDLELCEQEANKIRNDIEEIGHDIANYLPELTKLLKCIARMRVKNIIFHTDDFAIPWSWAYYDLDDHLLPYHHLPHYDFLANRYSCGTLLVDIEDQALERFVNFTDGFIRYETDEKLLGELEVCLFQGVLGQCSSREKISKNYIEHFKRIFKKRFRGANIKSFISNDWTQHSGKPEYFVKEFLSSKIEKAKIVHFSGHILNGRLKFDEKTLVFPSHLSDGLYSFKQNPLVILHGCSSGRIINMQRKDQQLPTVFLDKQASGCLVALLPVDYPIVLKDAPETMIDIFFNKVMEMKPYGQALLEARHEFQNNPKTKNNPQWLFFKLYGDPRAMLISTSGTALLKRFEIFEDMLEEQEQKQKRLNKYEGRIALAFEKGDFKSTAFIEELESNEVSALERVKTSGTLDASEMLGYLWSPEAIEIYKFIGTTAAGVVVKEIVKKTLDKILKKKKKKLEELKPSELKKKQKKGNSHRFLSIGYFQDPLNKTFSWATYEIVPIFPSKKKES